MRYVWAAPNSLVGVLFAPLAWTGRLRLVSGVLEMHGPPIAWLLRHCVPLEGGALAMTFGHIVIGRDADALETTRAHERVHVRQYELWGPAFIPAYLLASAWAAVRGEDAYNDNCFERQARAVERRACVTQARDQQGRIP